MRRIAKLLALLPALLAATPALAVDTSFHTYDGFAETVEAFRLVSMIFADPRYETLVLIVATVGIGLGAIVASVRGSGMGLVAFGFQMLFGVGLFVGLIATTGTVHVYDRVRNAYQPVGGVPNLLVLVAGVTNMIERALVETIDDNTIDPDAKIEFGAGGHSFDLFLNAVSPRGPMTDTFLDATIKDYVRQCYPVARVSAAYGIDDDKLFRTATDLPGAFAAMAGPATFSTVYTESDKGGTTMSCTDAWTHISDRLSDPALFDGYTRQICARTGFNVDDAQQMNRCRQQLGEMGQMMLGQPLSTQALLTHILLGNTVGDVLFEDSPASAARVMANRAVISNGLATLSVANEWMPTIRATVFGIMLFMVPVALLFILTPINLRVASFALGLFVFVALWGVIDAGIYQLTLGRAHAALEELRSNALAANAWLLAPSAAMKALAIFGSFRTAAAGLAGAFVFTVFRFSGNVFTSFTSGALGVAGQGTAAAAPMATTEGQASALEAQASALGTRARAAASSSFGDFGERSTFGANRAFGQADHILGERPGTSGGTAFALGGLQGAEELGRLAPALNGRDLADPQVARAVRANAATTAIHQFAEKDALRTLGTTYFGEGQTGEKAFAAFAQNLVQWRAFGDQRAYGMMMQAATRHFERGGYSAKDAELKASGIIAEAQSDPTFAKLIANTFDQERLLENDLTAAQTQVGAMEGRRDYAGDNVAGVERSNVATEQAWRSGSNQGQREAAAMLGLPVDETSRRIGFINALSGEARSTAITQLARATGRNEGQVERALERYNAAVSVGTADGATAEAAREGTSVYGRTLEAAGYDFAERSGKLDAQREVGTSGTRDAARIGEQRRQSENFGFAEGAAAAGVSTREAARLDSFIQALSRTAGNQVDMAEGGAEGIADRARNERLTRIVDNERLTRMQGLLAENGVTLTKRQIAMDQNGDLSLNLTPQTAAAMYKAGLINESQLGAIANGGRARFSFADNDLLVSSGTDFSRSARNDTSTRFEAGKQAGPDTIEHFMGGGEEGRAAMENWLRGGFEMDRKGNWRLKPQVADTLQRDVQAIMTQTGWTRSISRSAMHQVSQGTIVGGQIEGGASRGGRGSGAKDGNSTSSGYSGRASVQVGASSSDTGTGSIDAMATMDIVNYDVREAIANAERASTKSAAPEKAFSLELSRQILGSQGLRNRYLTQSSSGRGVGDWSAPLTGIEQRSILDTGRFSDDLDHSSRDGDAEFKKR
ncbi:conjugal transfer protein TraG N-terminal domain-containing protein [Sphingobium sp. H39-3-25]|uniref:conjugal transfer protein TraG N-terminal domain-containing protein n=1 Tax=Sphingomonadales TaxID=204457 RepID=UPI000835107F|nr:MULTISPECIES: conjugal transfer protein TraG N-terminal domain-containing protein [Sphingomonadaceae]MDF0491101.1 conjugal transfer protein TraG N-terminal domain-containing protein [Sphingomonas pollutisoli]MDF0545168.1 conjugal transfer protein TraG N-terminal domain-containing protein [Sphingobium arseniciresistens]